MSRKNGAASTNGRKSIRPETTRAPHDSAYAHKIKAPSAALLALEARAYLEFGAGLASWPLLQRAPRGDGHPVLVYPGFGAGNLSTLLLRRFLKSRGYEAHPWRFRINLGPRPHMLRGMVEQLEDLYRRAGRKVSLIGWSLGGIYARELAKVMPELVRTVITLGTPFSGPRRANNAWYLYELITGERVDEESYKTVLSDPPPVPTTSIYSRTDGIVAWQCCLQGESPLTENIEVPASHVGMGANPFTLLVIANRLAQPEGQWQHYKQGRIF